MVDLDTCEYCGDKECIGTCTPSAGGAITIIGLIGIAVLALTLIARNLLNIG
jgi:hypothetical protein